MHVYGDLFETGFEAWRPGVRMKGDQSGGSRIFRESSSGAHCIRCPAPGSFRRRRPVRELRNLAATGPRKSSDNRSGAPAIAEIGTMNRGNITTFLIGALVVIAIVLAYQLYQARKQPTGVEILVGPNGISIENK
jgi:hypothetical protein